MFYKKGHIVPRRLIRCKNRKTQHLWKFGADVDVSGRTITALTGGAVFYNSRSYIGGNNGRPRIYNRSLITGITVMGFIGSESTSVFIR